MVMVCYGAKPSFCLMIKKGVVSDVFWGCQTFVGNAAYACFFFGGRFRNERHIFVFLVEKWYQNRITFFFRAGYILSPTVYI